MACLDDCACAAAQFYRGRPDAALEAAGGHARGSQASPEAGPARPPPPLAGAPRAQRAPPAVDLGEVLLAASGARAAESGGLGGGGWGLRGGGWSSGLRCGERDKREGGERVGDEF
jgi:hypothetical protein